MAERDLEFTAGVTFDTGSLIAEIQRIAVVAQQAGASVNLQGPFENAALAARRAVQDFRAVDLSLVNIQRSAAAVNGQYAAQQNALQKVEATIRTIRDLPITSQAQFNSLRELERLRQQLGSNTVFGEGDPLGAKKLSETMAGATTAMERFKAELRGVEQAQLQVARIGKQMQEAVSGRIGVDPAFVQSLANLREVIQQTGPIARSTFNELRRSIDTYLGSLQAATQMELQFAEGLTQVQVAGQRVARGEQDMAQAIRTRDAAAERASADYTRALLQQERLLANIARLPTNVPGISSGAVAGLAARTQAVIQGPGSDPRELNELVRQYFALKSAIDAVVKTSQDARAEGQMVTRAEQEAAAAFRLRAAARERADQDYERALIRQYNLLRQIAALPAAKQAAGAELAGRVATAVGPTEDPRVLTQLNKEFLALKGTAADAGESVAGAGKKAAATVPVYEQLGKRIVSLTQYVVAAGVAYTGFQAVTGTVQHIVDLDAAMHRISATISDQTERVRVLPEAYELIKTAMTDYGLSTQDAGKLVTELTRSLNGNMQEVKASFLPALALTVRGEVDMAEASRGLIGTVNAFGTELIGASSKLEAYALVSDKILKASDQSVGSIGSLTQALNNVASRAALAGVSFSQTISLLSLLQDNLGAAGRSGTGLTRVFEGLILNTEKAAKLFGVAFDPAKPVKAFEVLDQIVGKLRSELELTKGLTSSLANEFQAIIGTEQGTKQLELLIRAWPELAKRIKESTESGGRHVKELEEHAAQLGVSFSRMANQALSAIDQIINGFSLMTGGPGGVPGQFTGLAKVFVDIGNSLEAMGKSVENTGRLVGDFVNSVKNFSLPDWLESILLATGAIHKTNISQATEDVSALGEAIKLLPDIPDWLKQMLRKTGAGLAGAAVGAAVGGPVAPLSAGAGFAAGWMAFDFTQWGLDADAAKKKLEELTKASAALQAQRGGERSPETYKTPEEKAAEALAVVEATRARILKERAPMVADILDKARSQVMLANQDLALETRIAEAQKVAAVSRKAYNEAEKEFMTGKNLDTRLTSDAQTKLAQLRQKQTQDEIAVNGLQATLKANRLKDDTQAYELAQKRLAIETRLTTEYQKATASTATPFQDLSMEQARADIATKIEAIKKEVGQKFSGIFEENVTKMITQTVIAELTNKQQAIFDAFVTPFRDAAEQSIIEIDKVIERAEYLARQRDKTTGNFLLSPEARTEALAAPARAVDMKLGTDVAERQLKSLTAAFNQFGEEAAAAMFAGSKGFESFSAMVTAAGVAAEYAGAHGLQVWIDGFLRFRQVTKEINLQQLKNDIAGTVKSIDDLMATGGDPVRILANANAWKKYNESLADLEISADGARRSVAALLVLDASKTIEKGQLENLQAQLNTLNNTNAGLEASFGQVGAAALATQLAYQLQGKSVGQLSAEMQGLIARVAEATQKQKELADAGGLQVIGFSPAAAASMAATLATQDDMNKKIDQGTDALKRWNTQAETAYARNLELVKQTAIDTKDYFSFLAASFEQGATAGHSMFEDLDTLAKNTANNMRTAFSDIFFATLQNNMKDAQAAFKNFFLSILREITNLMASQAVKGFMGLFGINVQGGQLSFAGGGIFGGGSAVGQPGGIGTSDITRSTSGGMNSAGFMPGEAGGDPFSAVKMGQAANSLLSAGKSLQGSAGVWDAVVSGWSSGEGLFGGIQGAATEGFQAMDAAFTGLTAVAAYAGAAISAVLTIMDTSKSNLGKAIQTATLAAGVALAPWTAGLSILAAGIINWIEDLFGLFKKGISSYTQKRIDALGKANEGLQELAKLYEASATTGDPAKFLGALRGRAEGGAGAGRGASTILLATPEMAAQLGLKVDPRNMQEGKFEVSWSDVTQAQFDELLKLLAKDENVIPSIVGGRVSVDYLTQDKVGEAEKRAAEIGAAMLKAFVAFQRVRNEITKLTDDIQDSIKDFLPEDLAQNFKARLLDPIREKIIAAVGSGLTIDKITAQLENLKATLAAYVNLVGLYGQLTQDFQMYSGDFVHALSFVNEQVDRTRRDAGKKIAAAAKDAGIGPDLVDAESGKLREVDDIVAKVQQAFAHMDLTPVQAFEKLTALRTAVIERYDLEKKLVIEAETGISKLYSEHVTGIIAFDQAIEEMNTALTGSDAGLNGMIQSLLQIGTTSLSVSESIYTVNAALDLFIKSLPARIAGKAGRPEDPSLHAGALPVDQILAATMGVVVPFAATLNREIRNAFDAGDFEAAFSLLQQLGAGLKSAMDAAVAGVRQWEQAQIGIINTEADRRIKEAGKVRDMYQKQLDGERDLVNAKLKAIQDQKDAIQDQRFVIEDQVNAIHDAMRPLEDQIKAITRQQELLRRSMRPIDAAIRGIGDLMRPIQAQVTALERQATEAQRIADDFFWNIGLQTYALEQQRTTIQDNIDLIGEMADAVQSVRDYLHNLALSNQAPPDAIGQFQLAKTSFDQLFTKFTQAPNAKGLGQLQGTASDLLGTLEPLYARASTEYRALYQEIVRKLEQATAVGATIGEPATLDDLKEQLKSLDDQLARLNKTEESSRHQLDLFNHSLELLKRPLEDQQTAFQDQIDALGLIKDGIQAQIDLLEDQKQPIQDQLDLGQQYLDNLDAQLTELGRQEELLGRTETTLNRDLARIADNQDTLNQLYQDYVDSINALREDAISATEASADAIVRSIEDSMMPLMTAVGWDAHNFYEWMRNEQYARLMDLTSGQGTAAWMRVAQQNTADWINAVRVALEGFLAGDMKTVTAAIQDKSTDERLIETLTNLDASIGNLNNYLASAPSNPANPGGNPPVPEPPNLGGLAEGAWNVAPGTYQIHANEMVVPKAQAEALRASTDSWAGLSRLAEGGGGNMSITIAPVIYSNQNPTAIVNQVVDRIVVDIRGGGAIQDAIARMPKRSR